MPFKNTFLLLISKDKVKGNCPFQKHLYYSSCFNEIILHVMVNHHIPIICLTCETFNDDACDRLILVSLNDIELCR